MHYEGQFTVYMYPIWTEAIIVRFILNKRKISLLYVRRSIALIAQIWFGPRLLGPLIKV